MSAPRPFFEVEKERLTGEIAKGFEQLLSASNSLNQKLEDGHGMTREYGTAAELWSSFQALMRDPAVYANTAAEADAPRDADQSVDDRHIGIPGTGGHVVSTSSKNG